MALQGTGDCVAKLRRWRSDAGLWILAFSAFLGGCAAQLPSLRGDGEVSVEQLEDSEQFCPTDRTVLFMCQEETCGFYLQRDGAHSRSENGATRGPLLAYAGGLAPAGAGSASAIRWWGNVRVLPYDLDGPILVFRFNEPERPRWRQVLLPFQEKVVDEWEKSPKELHHLFPQMFKDTFEGWGINVHDYVMQIRVDDHRRIHRGERGGPWNAAWRQFIIATLGQPPAKEEVFRYAGELIFRFQLGGPVMRYR